MDKKITIAIDGHSSTGKSTVAKSLAKLLNYTYIDSGAMYRCVTLYCLQKQIIKNGKVNPDDLQKALSNINITFTYNKQTNQHLTWLNGELVEDKIRELEVSNNVSLISSIGMVRQKLVQLQQQMGKNGGIVMDGRDIGTVVFPNAELKIFMTASADVRAKRRFNELKAKGSKVTFEEIKQNIEQRDFLDQTREISPLKKADDAQLLDNSDLTPKQQLDFILNLVRLRIKEA